LLALEKLTDKQLLLSLERAVTKHRRTTGELVAHIGEVDARGLYRNQACSSMHDYCVRRLHLSEAAAAKRIQVARATRRFAGLLDYLVDGRVHLSGLTLLIPHLDDDNWRAVVDRAVHKSKRQIEDIVAELAPRADIVTSMRRVPVRSSDRLSRGSAEGVSMLDLALMVDASSAPALSLPATTASGRERTDPEPLAPGRFKVQFTAGQALRDKIVHAQALLRHSIPNGDLAQVFERALDLLIDKARSRRFGQSRAPRKKKRASGRRSRHIPAAVKREVYERDGGRCTYVDAQGLRCAERGMLEYDHVVPYARDGPPTVDNIRLRCRAHNQLHAEETYGKEFMKKKRTG